MKKVAQYPRSSQDVFVTQKMLYKVRDNLKAHISSEIHSVNSKFHSVHSDIHSVHSKFSSIHSEFQLVHSKFESIHSEFQLVHSKFESIHSDIKSLKADVHRVALLVEEQNNRNKIVLDGLSHLWGRQDRLEKDFISIRDKSTS